jgi:putative aminopeptidase FrvX
MLEFDRLSATIEELVMLHFASGAESKINQRLMEKFAALGVNAWVDRANNAIALIPGRNPQKLIGISAHKKYEIGALENVGLMQALLDNFSECFLFLTQ